MISITKFSHVCSTIAKTGCSTSCQIYLMRPDPERHIQPHPHRGRGGVANIFQLSAGTCCWNGQVVGWRRQGAVSQWLNDQQYTQLDMQNVCVYYHGCNGATCSEIMSLQPAPKAQITSWPTGSVALLRGGTHTALSDPSLGCRWTRAMVTWGLCVTWQPTHL